MRDFMKGGLFCLFIGGIATCAMAAISGVVVILAEAPLFGTRQFEMLFGVAMVFWTGLGASVLCAISFAALEYLELKFPAARRQLDGKQFDAKQAPDALTRKAA
jgi:hypothetical protein